MLDEPGDVKAENLYFMTLPFSDEGEYSPTVSASCLKRCFGRPAVPNRAQDGEIKSRACMT